MEERVKGKKGERKNGEKEERKGKMGGKTVFCSNCRI